MKHNKLLTLSLLTSFLILVSASFGFAQNTLTYGSTQICPSPAGTKVYIPVIVANDVDLAAIDIVGQTVAGGIDATVTDVIFDDRLSLSNILDLRYGLQFLDAPTNDVFRFGAVKLTGTDLAVGDGQIGQLELTLDTDCLLGSMDIVSAIVAPYETAYVDADANLILPTVTAGGIEVVNADPFFTLCPADFEMSWTDNYIVQLEADDPDLACGCDALTYSLVDGPGSVSASGLYQFVPTGANIGCNTVTIEVADEYGGIDECTFVISVTNEAPEITCPDDIVTLWGVTVNATATAVDPDGGPAALTYSLGSFSGPGGPSVDPITGEFTWDILEEVPYIGTFEACIIVTDGANLDACNTVNADTCCFSITVEPTFQVSIEKMEGVLQGHYYDLDVSLNDAWTTMEMGGFDFLIAYDASALTFVSAEMGDLLNNCGWEYFTYRNGATGNCDGSCPSGLLRVVALAETNDGPWHPDCFDNADFSQLFTLKFLVTNDRTYECMYAPVEWFWLDCGDNTISSKEGDTLFLDRKVLSFDPFVGEITNHGSLPSYTGAPNSCLIGDKEFPLRAVDFVTGGFDIICSEDIDAPGDINVNGISNEIADAVMYSNYFINGLSVFDDHVEASIAASDVNKDGGVLSIADLVYLVRIIQGDALPYPKPAPAENVTVTAQQINGAMNVRYASSITAGAALLTFSVDGIVGEPTSDYNFIYSNEGNELRVLVLDIENSMEIVEGDLMTIPVEGHLELVNVDMADYNGAELEVAIGVLPSAFELDQNYPNPFNPTTTIALSLPVESDWSLTIYNVAGQVVKTFSGHDAASTVNVVWDGTDNTGSTVASGMYFYKASADAFTATKKMILMK